MASGFWVDLEVQAATMMEAEAVAETWCIEQSIEISPSVVPAEVLGRTLGRREAVSAIGPAEGIGAVGDGWSVRVAFPPDLVGDSASQFLNVLYGNGSLFTGIRVVGCDWTAVARNGWLQGPSFGMRGIWAAAGAGAGLNGAGEGPGSPGPLSCTALKPVGLSSSEFASLAYAFALGGIDVIKDDHGLCDQPSAPFAERLKACVEAVGNANAKVAGEGRRSVYAPNITGDGSQTVERFEMAVEAGAGAVLLIPHLCGLPLMHELAGRRQLPIMAHPAFSGTYVMGSTGFTPAFLYGELWRAFGADAMIYPNAGGRFPLSEADCHAIHRACRDGDMPFAAGYPTPGGGIRRETVPSLVETFGGQTLFLIGGSLYQHPGGIVQASRELRDALTGASDGSLRTN